MAGSRDGCSVGADRGIHEALPAMATVEKLGLSIADKDSIRGRQAILLRQFQVSMHKFQYRCPRYPVNLPVRLSFGGSTFNGRCREISQEGMCLELQQVPAANDCGTAFFSYENVSAEVGVCVAHAGQCSGGLKFVFRSDQQRMEVAHLVALVAACNDQPGLSQ